MVDVTKVHYHRVRPLPWRTSVHPGSLRRLVAALAFSVGVGGLTVPVAGAAPAEKQVAYAGVTVSVPADWPIIDTTFNPIQQIVRYAGASAQRLILDNPGKAKPMLEAVTETVICYMRALAAEGVDGVFYSTWAAATEAAPTGYSKEVFEDLVRPFDIAILAETKGVVRMLHACKNHLDLDRVADFPHEVLSWATNDPTCPTLSEMRSRSDKCLMGGINQARVIDQAAPEIRHDIEMALAETGGKKFILAPGCTFGSNAPDHVLATIAEYTCSTPKERKAQVQLSVSD